ncbi:hypothetical protein OPV22_021530 [Ensete ventricosum]|uniref:Serine-threonine/tyrosine-protein kinase catalytic domain-containing protein n=1 Tax=Ensete ventricosum TaxID=4639 RepID=A0AAV8QMN1_ENSVE|nr:hypothetical protein OPV22_021530 [Ensete ventricosum]
MRPSLAVALAVAATLSVFLLPADGTGSTSTLAIAHGSSSTVCGVLAGVSPRSIQCARADATGALSFPLFPNVSFASVSGGHGSLCGLRADGTAFFCWDAATLTQKRVYNDSTALEELAVGDVQIAGVDRNRTFVHWWRADSAFPDKITGSYRSLTSGRGFTCAISTNGSVSCWGPRSGEIPVAFVNSNMSTIVAGDSHACGVSTAGRVICGGNNDAGQSTPPSDPAFEFGNLALGSSHTCAVRRYNGTVVCWGAGAGGEYTPANTTAFVFIVAGGNLTCGLTVVNFTVLCWGTNRSDAAVPALPLPRVLPGICTSNESSCDCGPFPDSETLCSGSGVICRRCDDRFERTSPPPPPPPPSTVSSKRANKGWLAFAIVGSVGVFAGVCSIVYCAWFGICRHKKIHNSVQPTITAAGNGASHAAHSSATGAGSIVPSPTTSPSGSRSRTFWRQGSRVMRRQRSGPSSFKDRAEEFSFSELATATKNFSLETKIGAGSFGTAAGTVGYMDPEYYGLHHLTVKSDVYGLGVVMLEVLTGRRAIFKDEEGGNPTSVVDYAVPCIVAGDVGKVLDARVGQPGPQEAEAVELVAYTAVHCVHLEGKNRPNMTDIVANLESALALCEGSHGSISSASAD